MTVRRLTSPTTKVRRLGYIVGIASLLKRTGPIPEFMLVDKLERFAREHEGDLASYYHRLTGLTTQGRNVPGSINFRSEHAAHDAARRYISTSRELGLTAKIEGSYWNSRSGTLLASLDAGRNPFDLSPVQICYLVLTLLRADYDTFRILLVLLERHEDGNWKAFQERLIRRLVAERRGASSPFDIQRARAALLSVKNWGSKGKGDPSASRFYRENIRTTRIEWLKDLKAGDHDSNRLPSFRAFLLSEESVDDKWLANDYYGNFSRVYAGLLGRIRFRFWPDISQRERAEHLKAFVSESFGRYGQRELRRLSATQFLEYCTCNLVCKEGIIATQQDLTNDAEKLLAGSRSNFRFVRTVSRDEVGHIVQLPRPDQS